MREIKYSLTHPLIPEGTMKLLTIREVSALLNASDSSIRRWIKAGRLPTIRLGRSVRLRQQDIDRLMTRGTE